MKNSTLKALIPLLFFSFALHAQPAEKTLVKAFNLQGNNTVYLDVDAPVEVIEWSQDQMRVIMKLSLSNGHSSMLKSLVTVGRYNLESAESDEGLRIYAPGLEKDVKLRNGTELHENVAFEVYAPRNTLIKSKYDNSFFENN